MQVLLCQPGKGHIYALLADFLEQRLEERDNPAASSPEGSPLRASSRPPLVNDPSFERKVDSITEASVNAATKEHHGKHLSGIKKALKREGTFNIYDSGNLTLLLYKKP